MRGCCLVILSLALPCLTTTPLIANTASFQEIPYYLRQLEESQLESKRMEINKIIHDAVVNAPLYDKKVVKKMEPTIQKIQVAIDSRLDRPYLEGQSMWLQSAVDYFEREKNRQLISLAKTDWLPVQSVSSNNLRLSTFPDKIILLDGDKNQTIAESSDIHEAVISPDGKRVAFFRQTEGTLKAEVWVVNLKNHKRKKVATPPSCNTLLFSLDGDDLFLQEKPASASQESPITRVSAGGGGLKTIGKAQTLETIVAKGKYAGSLIVYKVTKHHLGTTQQDCAYAWEPSGKEIGRIKDTSCR